MKNYLNGLILSLAALVFYLSSMLLTIAFSGSFLFSLAFGGTPWHLRNGILLFVVLVVLPLLLYLIHNTFFVLFFRNMWVKHFPRMKHWQITLICWGIFLCPIFLHILAASAPAWKRGTRRAKWLFLLTAIFLLGIGPLVKLVPLPLYTNIAFYGAIVFLGLLFAFYCAVSYDALSHWAKLSSIILCVLVVPMIAWLFGLIILADSHYASSATKLAATNTPLNRAQYYQFFYDGVAIDENTHRWASLLENLPDVPKKLPSSNVLMTPALQVERDDYLKSVEPAMAEINQLVYHKIKRDVDQTKPLITCLLPHLSKMRRLAMIYSMRMQSALDGEHPDLKPALTDFSRSRELLKFCEPAIIGSLLACAVEGIRLRALGEIYARVDLPANDCRLLDKELAIDEQLINESFNRNIRMEAVFLSDTADAFLAEGNFGEGKYPFIKINRVLAAPFYVMIMEGKSFSNQTFANFISEIMDNSLDYWQLPKPLTWPDAKDYSSKPLCSMFLAPMDVLIVKKYEAIFRIRAMRLLLREKTGDTVNDLRDPFADAPLKVIRGEFKGGNRPVELYGKMMRGIRIYSVGKNGIDDNGEKDDVTFDIITELVK